MNPKIIKVGDVLINLLNRDADCRCGGMQLTTEEVAAIHFAATKLKNKYLSIELKG